MTNPVTPSTKGQKPGNGDSLRSIGQLKSRAGHRGRGTPQVTANGLERQRQARLERTIEGEIIPRLMLSHGITVPASLQSSTRTEAITHATMDDCAQLARMVIHQDVPFALSFLDTLLDRGVPLEEVFQQVLCGTAALIGQFWENDVCCFAEVTIGLSRLQQLVHELAPAMEREAAAAPLNEQVLLLPAPGEQHTFALGILAVFFRRAGFNVWGGDEDRSDQLIPLLSRERFAAIGFSAASEDRLDRLAALIRWVRRSTPNGEAFILVGGGAFRNDHSRVKQVGADAMALDGQDAVVQTLTYLKHRQDNVLHTRDALCDEGVGFGNEQPAPPWADQPVPRPGIHAPTS